MTIIVQNLSIQEGKRQILDSVSFSMKSGECIGLVGPNGAGKTSLMRGLLKMDDRATGSCSLWDLSMKARAKEAAWLAQERSVGWELSVLEILQLGRIPWQGFAGRAHAEDGLMIEDALSRLELNGFENRRFMSLSGGERARVLIARLLAQNTPYIFADEPIAALDPFHQLGIMSLFQNLAISGRGIMLSIHDLSFACRFCSRIILMDKGAIIADGKPEEVLNHENIAQVFRVRVAHIASEYGPILQPLTSLDVKDSKPQNDR